MKKNISAFLSKFHEPFNGFSHLISGFIAVVMLGLLIVKAKGDPIPNQISFWVYGASLISMFISSAIYHLAKVRYKTSILLKKIDHIMIFFLIAGTYTPVTAVGLGYEKAAFILAVVWIIALLGTLKKIFWIKAPRWISTAVYLGMGWISVFIFPELWGALPPGFLIWIGVGGLFYTVGAMVYWLKKPDPLPQIFGFHGLWHLFVIGGAFSHFWAIFYYLPALNG